MENVLDYLLYALFGLNVTSVRLNVHSGNSALVGKSWTFCFEDHVFITLDESGLAVIRSIFERRKLLLDDENYERYMKIFNACI